MLGAAAMSSVAAALVVATPGTGTTQSSEIDPITASKLLIQANRSAAARELLEHRIAAHPADVEGLFLLGIIAMAEANREQAIARFRRALVYAPDALRIRLELARAFYLEHDYENAFRQFQLARAGNPPSSVVASIERYLSAIRLEKAWSYTFSFSIAPDTNINNGTSARDAELFGLPFQLSDQTRRHSGVGAATDAGIEFAPSIGKRSRVRIGASIQRRTYRQHEFDDTVVAAQAGPRFVLGKWDLSLLGTAYRRRYGGRELDRSLGTRLEVAWYPGARTALSLVLSAQDLQYPAVPQQSGPVYAAYGGVMRALTASSTLALKGGASRQNARGSAFANWSAGVGLAYYRDLPGGFSVDLEPSFNFARYDGVDPLFGARRKDRLAEMQIAVLQRRIVFSRFTPRVAYTFAKRRSNIDLFDFNQNRLEVGITSEF